VRTFLQRLKRRHSGADTELARFVIARRQDSATISSPTNGNRSTGELGMITDLDRRVETIHVKMDDLPGHSES
jgi:hypothetical protein